MIEATTIDGEKAVVAYLTADLAPAERDDAELVKVIFLDGRIAWLIPPKSKSTDDDEAEDFRADFAKDAEFDPKVHPRGGNPDNPGEFSEGGGGAVAKAPEAEPVKPEAEAPEPPQHLTRPVGAKPPRVTRPPGAKPAAIPKAPPRPKKPVYGPPEVFVSPNTGELTFPGAEHELHSKRQDAFHKLNNAVDTRLGLRTDKGVDVLGAWTDGAENTVMSTYSKNADFALVRAAAAIKASVTNQKSTLIFRPNDQSKNHMVTWEITGDLGDIHDALLQEGVSDHTLEPTKDGARVHVYVDTDRVGQTIEAYAKATGAKVSYVSGDGEFIGNDKDGTDEEQRANAQRVYHDIIEEVAAARGLGEPDIRDVWADAGNHWRSEIEGTPLVGSQGHAGLISTRRPHAVGSLEGDRYRQIGLAAEEENSELFEAHTDLFKDRKNYPNLRPSETQGKSPKEIADAFKAHIKANLRFLYHAAPEEMRARAHLWYEGAHDLAAAAAKRHSLPVTSTAGVYAALSPQKLWDMNVYLADAVIDIHQTKQKHEWDDEMGRTATRIWTPKKPPKTPIAIANAAKKARIVGLMRGQTLAALDQLPDPDDRLVAKAMWIRTYDEAHSNRQFNRLAPDSASMGVYRKKPTAKQARAGQPGDPAKAAWQSIPSIANAIKALESDGKRNIISEAMGAQHKVRSFYNNILDPHSANEDVTMDTHAIGAALLRPLSGADTPVMHSLATSPATGEMARAIGYKKPMEDSQLGINGTYAIYADAYRELAHELSGELKRKIEPRELQSVTWEAKRAMFDNTTTDKQMRDTEEAWNDYHHGYLSLASTQKRVLGIAGGFKRLEDIQDTHD